MSRLDFLLKIYPTITNLLFPMVKPFLRRGHAEGFDERCGYYNMQKMEKVKGRSLWVHAVSVGEVQAAFPLIREMRRSGCRLPILLSTVTETGQAMAKRLMDADLDVILFAPWDIASVVDRALNAINPCAYITMETEIWPNILLQLHQRGIPSFLVNGRVSDRALARAVGWKKGVLSRLLRCFTRILARENSDADRFCTIGAEASAVTVVGDCKVDALLERRGGVDRQMWKDRLYLERCISGFDGAFPLFLAGSTHPGEDEVVLEAFSKIRTERKDARLLLVPRHPVRADGLLPAANEVAKSCLLSKVDSDWEIVIVDQIGVLFELYALCTAAFIGGSLVPKGGQNLQEAACWGIPIQHGMYMDDFAQSAQELGKMGLAVEVRTAEDLYYAWCLAMGASRNEKAELQRRCDVYFEERAGAAKRAWTIVSAYL